MKTSTTSSKQDLPKKPSCLYPLPEAMEVPPIEVEWLGMKIKLPPTTFVTH